MNTQNESMAESIEWLVNDTNFSQNTLFTDESHLI